jgi:hypothetical protein
MLEQITANIRKPSIFFPFFIGYWINELNLQIFFRICNRACQIIDEWLEKRVFWNALPLAWLLWLEPACVLGVVVGDAVDLAAD